MGKRKRIVQKSSTVAPPGAGAASVTISHPANSSVYAAGGPIQFVGSAVDAKDGDISGRIVWTSDIEGNLGTGGSLTVSGLGVGMHTIRASVVNSAGAVGSATVSVTTVA